MINKHEKHKKKMKEEADGGYNNNATTQSHDPNLLNQDTAIN